jgi:hypothetical protein
MAALSINGTQSTQGTHLSEEAIVLIILLAAETVVPVGDAS